MNGAMSTGSLVRSCSASARLERPVRARLGSRLVMLGQKPTHGRSVIDLTFVRTCVDRRCVNVGRSFRRPMAAMAAMAAFARRDGHGGGEGGEGCAACAFQGHASTCSATAANAAAAQGANADAARLA